MIILPSLEIVPAKYNVSTSTLLSQIPIDGTGDFTVTRATSPTTGQSTRVNALGQIELVADNVPRLDYPLGGAVNGCPALLVEPSAQNLVLRSEEFNDAYWSKDAGVTVDFDVDVAPNGATTADRLNLPTNGAIYRSGLSLSGSHTFSIYLKGEGQNIGKQVLLEFTNGNSTVTLTGNWQRFTTTGTNIVAVAIKRATSQQATSVLAWGAQVETGSVATSYIPTTTGSVTRNADVVLVSGAVSGSIGQTEGTMYIEVQADLLDDDIIFINRQSGAGSNSVNIVKNSSNQVRGRITYNNTHISFTTSAAVTGMTKIAIAYKTGDSAMYVNGVSAGTSTTAFSFTAALSSVVINKAPFLFGARPNNIRAAALYTTRLTDTQLALLTSPYTSYSSMASALSYTLG